MSATTYVASIERVSGGERKERRRQHEQCRHAQDEYAYEIVRRARNGPMVSRIEPGHRGADQHAERHAQERQAADDERAGEAAEQ